MHKHLFFLLSVFLTIVSCQRIQRNSITHPLPTVRVTPVTRPIPTSRVTQASLPRLPPPVFTVQPFRPRLVGYLQVAGGLYDGHFLECDGLCYPTENNTLPNASITYGPVSQWLLDHRGNVCNQDIGGVGEALFFNPIEDFGKSKYTAIGFQLHNGILLTVDPHPQSSNNGNTLLAVGSSEVVLYGFNPLGGTYQHLAFVPALRIVPVGG
ncbi:hypothetical protein TWF696_001117 [Orbilia brochopaga]|uniref:Uncharacterized protein n=1 Tax=Orbilia brochopaga TaxID=3140254 RepID=A0AAV9VFS9_9PEZI